MQAASVERLIDVQEGDESHEQSMPIVFCPVHEAVGELAHGATLLLGVRAA